MLAAEQNKAIARHLVDFWTEQASFDIAGAPWETGRTCRRPAGMGEQAEAGGYENGSGDVAPVPRSHARAVRAGGGEPEPARRARRDPLPRLRPGGCRLAHRRSLGVAGGVRP